MYCNFNLRYREYNFALDPCCKNVIKSQTSKFFSSICNFSQTPYRIDSFTCE